MSRVIGIDLGTTNSLVAYMDGDAPKVIQGDSGDKLVPSVVSVLEDGWVVGEAAKERLLTHPGQTIYSVKRLMGKGLSDVETERPFFTAGLSEDTPGIIRIALGGKTLTPPEVSALILKEIKKRAEGFFGEEVTQAVITVPAHFNDSQRQATKDAGRIAGLEVLRIVNEPTAACLSYGLQKKKKGIVAVYDLGGGTFDVSILKINGGIFEVLSTNGDTHLGGDDIDARLAERILGEIREKEGADFGKEPRELQTVRLHVEKAKRLLSTEDLVEVVIPLDGGRTFKRGLKRTELETLAKSLVERTLGPCRQALSDAGLTRDGIDEVVLVGGVTRMPLVRDMIREFFQKEPHFDHNPDEVVALGAAVQADILAGGTQNLLLLDVNPLSLGIETMGGVISVLIPRNSTIPTSVKELFTTYVDGQRAVDIHVLQGERELVRDNRSLCRFQLKDIDPLPAGTPRIEVNFTIDANGILHVAAKDLRSGKEQAMEVKPSYGLNDQEVERMVQDSYKFAKSDIQERMLIEAKNEAEIIIRHTERALKRNEGIAGEEEIQKIHSAVSELKSAAEGRDHRLIRSRMEVLDRVTRPLAEKIMDSGLKESLQDKKLSELP